jgi:L-ascorbate metabolism protein UlaG (beta-lactamase superfamily)
MIIQWLGHASFLIITENGTKIITDPYQSGAFEGTLNYRPITIGPDVVTVSHHHADHGYIDDLPNHFEVLSKAGTKVIKGITFKGVKTYHDEEYGECRGDNIIFTMNPDRIRIAHLGDLGHEISNPELEQLGEVDILLIPVGGNFTIGPKEADRVVDRVKPKIVIPMHFKTDQVAFDIGPVDDYLKDKTNVLRINRSEIQVSAANLPDQRQIIVLEPELA